jgi:hypothetical protein
MDFAIFAGFATIFSDPVVLLCILGGVLAGVFVGALPGLTATRHPDANRSLLWRHLWGLIVGDPVAHALHTCGGGNDA